MNLAEAFESPVQPDREVGGYNALSVKRMVEYEKGIEKDFVSPPIASWVIGSCSDELGSKVSLSEALEGIEELLSKEI